MSVTSLTCWTESTSDVAQRAGCGRGDGLLDALARGQGALHGLAVGAAQAAQVELALGVEFFGQHLGGQLLVVQRRPDRKA